MIDISRAKHSAKKSEPDEILANKDQSKYWSGIRKMMHMMRWSRTDKYNATCTCERHMVHAGKTHYNAMICIMNCCVTTPKTGLVFKPFHEWDGIYTDYKFKVMLK